MPCWKDGNVSETCTGKFEPTQKGLIRERENTNRNIIESEYYHMTSQIVFPIDRVLISQTFRDIVHSTCCVLTFISIKSEFRSKGC